MPRLILDTWHGERGIDYAPWIARHDLWGVIAKCGGSDDRYWNRYEETTWVEQATQANALGLHVGAYYYSDALTAADALEDAKHCVEKCMRGVQIGMPIYLDIEEKSQLRLPKERLTEVVTTFCDYIVAHGYQAGIYSGYEGFSKMETSRISDYSLWLAYWQESWPKWAAEYDLWQEGSISIDGTRYHKDGEVDKPGRIDLDWASDAFVRRIESGGGDVTRRMIDVANEAAEIHAFMCTDPRFGYSQDPRWGGDYNNGEVATFTSKAGYTYRIPCGSYDCSSSSTMAWKLAFTYTKHAGCLGDNPYECTSTMRATFCKTGLFMASLTFAKRGDLYLNEGHHVAMCQDGSPDNDILSEFNMDENRRATGGRAGDQTGGESVIRGYYDDHWNTVLHYIGGPLEDVTAPTDEPEKEETMTAFFVKFDGDNTEHFCEDGIHLHAIANGDEKKAIIDFWKLGHPGQALDPNPKTFGSKDAPWGARYNDVMSRGANFAGFERFNKHPSTRAVVRDENARQTDEIMKKLDERNGE